MRITIFPARPTVDAAVADAIVIALPHMTADLATRHTCYLDGSHAEQEGHLSLHRVTDEHLRAIHDAMPCPYREQAQDVKLEHAPLHDLSRLLRAAVEFRDVVAERVRITGWPLHDSIQPKYAELSAVVDAIEGVKAQ